MLKNHYSNRFELLIIIMVFCIINWPILLENKMQNSKKKANQDCQDMVDALRAMMGMRPLYGSEKEKTETERFASVFEERSAGELYLSN